MKDFEAEVQSNVGPLSKVMYFSGTSGHQSSYATLLGPMLGLRPFWGPMSLQMIFTLCTPKQLLLGSIDYHFWQFLVIVFIRALLGRRTAAIFLRPQSCFASGSDRITNSQLAKFCCMRAVRKLKGLTVFTITPFSVAPQFEKVAHVGLADPQYWDVAGTKPPNSDLASSLKSKRHQKHLLIAPGVAVDYKGLEFIANTMVSVPEFNKICQVVIAGQVQQSAVEIVNRIEEQGGIIINKLLSDVEIESLYGVADLIWACYRPDYNQASGIFGRAFQFNVPTIVRRGSLVEQTADAFDFACLPVEYGCSEELMQAISGACSIKPNLKNEDLSKSLSMCLDLRNEFEQELRKAL